MDGSSSKRAQRVDSRSEASAQASLVSAFGSFVGVQDELVRLNAEVKRLTEIEVEIKTKYGEQQNRAREMQRKLSASSGPELYARYASEISLAAAAEVALGKMTVSRMIEYSHAKFIDTQGARALLGVTASPTFFQVIFSTYEAVLLGAAASASSSSSSSAAARVGSLTAAMKRTCERCTAATISSAFAASKGTYQSVVAFCTSLNVLAATRSPFATDMIADAIPGGVSAQTINNHCYGLVKEQLKWRDLPPHSATLILCHDNNSVNYTPKTSRSGISANKLNSAMVWTMRELFAY